MDNPEGGQAPLDDPCMELDKFNENQTHISGTSDTIARTETGTTRQESVNSPIIENKGTTSRFTLMPYLMPSESPEKKKPRKGTKRTLVDISKPDNYPKFLVLKRTEEASFAKISPFLINKLITSEFGTVANINKLPSGALLIETTSKHQSEKILKTKSLGEFSVCAEMHRTLNTSRGMITCFDLEYASEEEILEDLKYQGVIAVRKFFRKKASASGQKTEWDKEFTGSVMLTFDRPELPSNIQAAFYKLKVRPYRPPPLRCFKCQAFGHSARKCRSEREICICGYPPHHPNPCPNPPKCPNCNEAHNAKSKECQEYKIEQEIQKLRLEIKDLTFKQARVLVNSDSYARRGTYSLATQGKANQNCKSDKHNVEPKKSNPTPLTPIPPPPPPQPPKPHSNPPLPSPHQLSFEPPSLPPNPSTSREGTKEKRETTPSTDTDMSVKPPPLPPDTAGNEFAGGSDDDGGGEYIHPKRKGRKTRTKK